MFDILTPKHTPFSRRGLLRIGAISLGGWTLAGALQREPRAMASSGRKNKSIIMIYLPGGASHIDMYDMKPEAPAEYRGEFSPIATNVPGIQVCELMPHHARIADKFAILRGVRMHGNHDPTEYLTGIHAAASGQIGSRRRPAIGCVVSKFRGVDGPIPPYVSVSSHKLLGSYDDPEEPAYLGPTHRPISLAGDIRQDMELSDEIKPRFETRRSLLSALDRYDRERPELPGYTRRALEMLTETRIREALDLTKESPATRAAYGEGTDPHAQGLDLLRARRLVEAGVSMVSVAARFRVSPVDGVNDPGGWDTHAANFRLLRKKLPIYDQAIAALISDLHDRGMAKDTLVVIGSEFGRQPRIGDVTPDGRGHWPSATCVVFAGGGLPMGQVIGETDARGEKARYRPYGSQDVLATLYRYLGIDSTKTLTDHNGRPQLLVDEGEPIAQLG